MQSSFNSDMKITIDQKSVEVNEGTTVMEAAASLGIEIPSMCFLKGGSNHPSCMVCLVKNEANGNLFASCAMPVSEGMNITTGSPDVIEARKEALELLLSDHVGDCEAPCRRSCPAYMDIPLMNRLISTGDFDAALKVVREEIALPLILGYICPAPCEKACHRKPSGGSVSICLLKRSTAHIIEYKPPSSFEVRKSGSEKMKTGKKVAIIGTGPAGLSAAFYLLLRGHECVLFDKNELPGGTLRYDIPDDHLPKDILDKEIDVIRKMGAQFQMKHQITKEYFEYSVLPEFDAVILATGNKDQQPLDHFGFEPKQESWISNQKSLATSRKGIFACGSILREQTMAVRSAAQGKAAAVGVHVFLTGEHPVKEKMTFHSVIGHLDPGEQNEYLKESIAGNRVEPQEGFLSGFTREEAISEAQRCMHCDCRKPVSCKLRIYADLYHADRRKFAAPERKKLTKAIQHETVIYEAEKCIKCGLCVEISRKEESALGMTFIGRGFDVKIGVPFTETIKHGLDKTAFACVIACPTGALALKKQEERWNHEF
jgi:NADPH-dependent glutamate synthase beta subunit-like oxidoreductase